MIETEVDIKSQEFKDYIKCIVLETLKEALSEIPPRDELGAMLLAHIKDFERFRIHVDNEFSSIKTRLDGMDARFDRIESRLDRIEATMVTKDELKDAVKNLVTKDELKELVVMIGNSVRTIVREEMDKKT